jgi:sugar/nucleoside kinase (ribokinase family)
MKITIISNIALDRIINQDGQIIESLGGPPCYCGLTSKQFGFKVELVSKFGKDLIGKHLSFFKENDLDIHNSLSSEKPTTRFTIKIMENGREISLSARGDSISLSDVENIKTDCWLLSPILDEVPQEVLNYVIHKGDSFVMLDPQGYTRYITNGGRILIRKGLDFSLQDIDAIKLDPHELECISGTSDFIEAQKWKLKNKINFLIFTENRTVHMLHNDKHYWLGIDNVKTKDSTGAGDILSSAFTCSYVKENDYIWALSFGVGALMAALKKNRNGTEKIPQYKHIEQNASYNYNLIKYENI